VHTSEQWKSRAGNKYKSTDTSTTDQFRWDWTRKNDYF